MLWQAKATKIIRIHSPPTAKYPRCSAVAGMIQKANWPVMSPIMISFDKVVSVVLDDRSDADAGGLLYHPEDPAPYGGQYVLVPQTGDYSQIHAFVQRYLFGNK